MRRRLDYADADGRRKGRSGGSNGGKERKEKQKNIGEGVGKSDVAQILGGAAGNDSSAEIAEGSTEGRVKKYVANTRENEAGEKGDINARKSEVGASGNDAIIYDGASGNDAMINNGASGDDAIINNGASGNDAIINNGASAQEDIDNAADEGGRDEWRKTDGADTTMETDDGLPVTPGKTPPREINAELEKVTMVTNALEQSRPDILHVRDGMNRLGVRGSASDKLPKNGLGDGGVLKCGRQEAPKAAATSQVPLEPTARNDDRSAAGGSGIGKIPKKAGGSGGNISHNQVADKPHNATSTHHRDEEERKRRTRDGGRRKFTKEDRCYSCNKRGHYARDCRFRREPANKKRGRQSDTSDDDDDESEMQRKMRQAARKMARAAKHYDCVISATKMMKADK